MELGKIAIPVFLTLLSGYARSDTYMTYREPEIKTIKSQLRQAKHDAFIAANRISDLRAIHLLESAQDKGLKIRVLVEEPTPALLRSNLKYVRVCKPGEIQRMNYLNAWKVITKPGSQKGWLVQAVPGPSHLQMAMPPDTKPQPPIGSVMILDNQWTWHGPENWSVNSWTGHSGVSTEGFFNVPPMHELNLDKIWRHSRNARSAIRPRPSLRLGREKR